MGGHSSQPGTLPERADVPAPDEPLEPPLAEVVLPAPVPDLALDAEVALEFKPVAEPPVVEPPEVEAFGGATELVCAAVFAAPLVVGRATAP